MIQFKSSYKISPEEKKYLKKAVPKNTEAPKKSALKKKVSLKKTPAPKKKLEQKKETASKKNSASNTTTKVRISSLMWVDNFHFMSMQNLTFIPFVI